MTSSRAYLALLLCLTASSLTSAAITNQGWWKNAVFYQIYPRSFMDSNNDGKGDLQGITKKLEHFVDIGVTGIWLSPINKSPMLDFGYDISDFRDIQSDYGTIADFEALVKRAKELGLRVILDLVPNHSSDQHEWFKKSQAKDGKYTDYYTWVKPKTPEDTTTPPNNWLSVFGKSAWTFDKTRKEWYFHQFLPQQPDLNYWNPQVKLEMQQVIEYWLMNGVDGFRIDAVPHLFETQNLTLNEAVANPNLPEGEYARLNHTYTKDHEETFKLVHEWRNIVETFANANPNFSDEKVLMTEAYTSLANIVKLYESGAHIPFNFNFIVDVTKDSSAEDFKKVVDDWLETMPANAVANWVMGNHDRPRVGTRYQGRSDQMTMLAMTLPGIAVTYYGEEIGMVDNSKITWEETVDQQACNVGKEGNWAEKSRDPCRTPFQWDSSTNAGFNTGAKTWLPVNENYAALNLAQQKTQAGSHYQVYKTLSNLRKSSSALKEGTCRSLVQGDNKNVLAIVREAENEMLTLLINFADNAENVVNVTSVTNKTLEATVSVVASVGSNVEFNKTQEGHAVKLPAKATVLVRSTFQVTGGASQIYCNYFLTVVVLVSSVISKF